jgi:hypothetical protein
MTKVYLYSPDKQTFSSHKADFGFLKEAFDIIGAEVIESLELPKTDRAFVVVPGQESAGKEDDLSKQLSRIDRVVLFITSDETGSLNIDAVSHGNIEIWVQSPFLKHKKYNKFPIGSPATIANHIPEYTNKNNSVFFSGQITHQRRQELAIAMRKMKAGIFNPTNGFMQGYAPDEYYLLMAQSRIIPAPAGNVTIDSFRFYEALEMLSLPIGDTRSSSGTDFDFFGYVFGDLPIKRLSHWRDLYTASNKLLNKYPENLHKAVAWWIRYKRDFRYKIMEQLNEH